MVVPNKDIEDYQCSILYKAEESCKFWDDVSIIEDDYVLAVIGHISYRFNIITPKLFLLSESKKFGLIASATSASIILPFPAARCIQFICHEMAHVINYQVGEGDHHGPNFAGTYLKVINNFIGMDERTELINAFNRYGVKYNMEG